MIASLPTGRRGQALALALTLAVLCVLWIGCVSPLIDTYAAGAARLEQRRTLARHMAELVRTLPTLRQQADAVAASGPPPQMVLSGDSDALAGASLQEQVQEMAAHAGASLTSTEALPASAAGEYRRIGIRLSVSGAWPVLVRLLQSIEQATPRMLIDDVQLQGSPVHIQGLGLPLDASFTVLAFRHAAAPAPGGQPEPATGAVRTTP